MDIDVIADHPDWLPHRLTANGAAVDFVHVPRALHRSITFLDDQYLGKVETRNVPVDALARRAPPPAPAHFIFHSAFCCSTLLARAFDIDGMSMGLKEPAILNQIAAVAREKRSPDALLAATLPWLCRPIADGEATIIKPSNVANNLIEPLLAARPDARAILLSAPLPVFLSSVAKKGMFGRIWMRRFHSLIARTPSFDPGYSATEIFEQTDLQIAAMAWLQQQAQFAAIVRRHGPRIRTLSSETLLERKAATLAQGGALFGLPVTAALAEQIATGPAFSSHAKAIGQDYDMTVRAEEREQVDKAHGEEIGMVAHWTKVVADQFGIPMTLPGALG